MFKHFKFSLITPLNLRLWWNIGRILGILIFLQIIRGFMLTFYYRNTDSFISMLNTYLEVLNSKLIQIIHINFSRIIFLFLYLHIIKAFYYTSFINQSLIWTRGIFILLLIIAISFLGYVLPWGQIRLWGATVITNLIRVLPWGKILTEWVWRGYFVSFYTLKLFFSLHFILPILLLLLILFHIIVLHYKGSSNPLSLTCELNKKEFLPRFLVKDLLNLIIIFLTISFIFFKPFLVVEEENYVAANTLLSPVHIKPEWYFLQFYAILRAIPNKAGGFLFFIMSIFLIFLIIIIQSKLNFNSITLWKSYARSFITINLLLMWLGAQPVTNPFYFLSQIFTFFYFLWFFILIFLQTLFIKNL